MTIFFTFVKKGTNQLKIVDYGYGVLFPNLEDANIVLNAMPDKDDYEIFAMDLELTTQ